LDLARGCREPPRRSNDVGLLRLLWPGCPAPVRHDAVWMVQTSVLVLVQAFAPGLDSLEVVEHLQRPRALLPADAVEVVLPQPGPDRRDVSGAAWLVGVRDPHCVLATDCQRTRSMKPSNGSSISMQSSSSTTTGHIAARPTTTSTSMSWT